MSRWESLATGSNTKNKWLSLGLATILATVVVGLSGCSSSSDDDSKGGEAAQAEAQAVNVAQTNAEADPLAVDTPYFKGRVIYLRGEMNDYGVQRPYRLREFEPNLFCTLAPLRSDWSPYRFKFADASWTEGTNFGYAVPPAIIREGSSPALLNPSSRFEELRYEPESDGIYRFCIVYDNDLPYATVARVEDGKLTTIEEVIREEINSQFSIASIKSSNLKADEGPRPPRPNNEANKDNATSGTASSQGTSTTPGTSTTAQAAN